MVGKPKGEGRIFLYTYPWAKRDIRLSLHEDLWEKLPPNFKRKAVWKGNRLKQEMQRIYQKYIETRKKVKI